MTAPEHLLILGASTRAAALSALRAGLRPWCVDLFADLDLERRCAVTRLAGRYPHAFLRYMERELPGPWMYTGGLENWPRLVERMARRRPLWGNGEPALSRARSPEHVADRLHALGMSAPALCRSGRTPDQERRWLLKPRKGAAGAGIRFWSPADGRVEGRSAYCQEYIDGQPLALLFLGARGQSRLLGMTRQLVGTPWLHAAPFHYAGSIGPLDAGIVQCPALEELGHLFASECFLEGLFGVDGVLRDGVFWPVEINPRYTASVEVLEYATGLRALAEHADVFTHGTLPASPPHPRPLSPGGERGGRPPPHPRPLSPKGRGEKDSASLRPYVGKAILFARADLLFPADGPWLRELRSPTPLHEMPAFADIPAAGTPIEAGRPILTFFARANSPAACEDALRRTAADLDRWLFGR